MKRRGSFHAKSKYYREQAEILAGLALSTKDKTEAARFTQAALEHLHQAQALDASAAAASASPATMLRLVIEVETVCDMAASLARATERDKAEQDVCQSKDSSPFAVT